METKIISLLLISSLKVEGILWTHISQWPGLWTVSGSTRWKGRGRWAPAKGRTSLEPVWSKEMVVWVSGIFVYVVLWRLSNTASQQLATSLWPSFAHSWAWITLQREMMITFGRNIQAAAEKHMTPHLVFTTFGKWTFGIDIWRNWEISNNGIWRGNWRLELSCLLTWEIPFKILRPHFYFKKCSCNPRSTLAQTVYAEFYQNSSRCLLPDCCLFGCVPSTLSPSIFAPCILTLARVTGRSVLGFPNTLHEECPWSEEAFDDLRWGTIGRTLGSGPCWWHVTTKHIIHLLVQFMKKLKDTPFLWMCSLGYEDMFPST